MDFRSFRELKIGDLIARLPIIQGGMGVGVSLSCLASAVANQGGIGVIAAAGIGMREIDFQTNYLEANIRGLQKEIRLARSMTKGILGVNIMVALSNFADLVKTAIHEKIDIIFSGAGLPLNLPSFLPENAKTKLVPIISSARAASVIARRWFEKYKYVPDAFVVEGPKAGGHLGFKPEQIEDPDYQLEKLIPEVIQEVKKLEETYHKTIPVIAGGGIYNGQDILRFIEMGASGVQMATRFVTTEECDASLEFKKCYLNAKKEDIVIIKSPVGLPGRAIKNEFVKDVISGMKKPFSCGYHCIITCDFKNCPFCIASALIHAQRGEMEDGFAFSGTNAYRAEKIISVKELIETITKEYQLASSERN
jgi:NAD(P)H-dependent flavin oxidoreductase YrpB (nitropropane dioxygenase family)